MDIFSTKRLVFLPVEDTREHDDFLFRLRSSPSFPNLSSELPLPGGSENSKAIIKFAANKRLAVYVCLPPNAEAEDGEKTAPEAPISTTSDASTSKSKPKPKIIGLLQLSKPGYGTESSFHHADGEIALILLPEYTGKGYGREAAEWMLWYGFVVAGLHRVGIACFSWNKGARRLYERIGFVLEGIEREKFLFMGSRHDLIRLGMLRREWLALQKEKGENAPLTGEGLDSDAIAKLMGCT